MNSEWAIEEIKMEIKIFLELNENENPTNKYLEDTREPILIGNFITPTVSIKKVNEVSTK